MNPLIVVLIIISLYLAWKHELLSLFTGKRVEIRSKGQPTLIIPTNLTQPVAYFGPPLGTTSGYNAQIARTIGTDLSNRMIGAGTFNQTEQACKSVAYDFILGNKTTDRKYTLLLSNVGNGPSVCRIVDNHPPLPVNASNFLTPNNAARSNIYLFN